MSTLRVAEPFACGVNGLPRVYRTGDLVDSKDPVVKGREKLFVDVEEFAQRSANLFEQATAVPNQPRARTKPVKGARKTAPNQTAVLNQPAPDED